MKNWILFHYGQYVSEILNLKLFNFKILNLFMKPQNPWHREILSITIKVIKNHKRQT